MRSGERATRVKSFVSIKKKKKKNLKAVPTRDYARCYSFDVPLIEQSDSFLQSIVPDRALILVRWNLFVEISRNLIREKVDGINEEINFRIFSSEEHLGGFFVHPCNANATFFLTLDIILILFRRIETKICEITRQRIYRDLMKQRIKKDLCDAIFPCSRINVWRKKRAWLTAKKKRERERENRKANKNNIETIPLILFIRFATRFICLYLFKY